jgi:hypothetical protein
LPSEETTPPVTKTNLVMSCDTAKKTRSRACPGWKGQL